MYIYILSYILYIYIIFYFKSYYIILYHIISYIILYHIMLYYIIFYYILHNIYGVFAKCWFPKAVEIRILLGARLLANSFLACPRFLFEFKVT